MINFNKDDVREQITIENIYDLLVDLGGEPEYTNFGIISSTICHNEPGEGSRKLYFYENSNLFHCYTSCEEPTFDIFELIIKAFAIQRKKIITLNDAVRFIASRLAIEGTYENDFENIISKDWDFFEEYYRVQNLNFNSKEIVLKEYDKSILNNFNYKVVLKNWLDEGIGQNAIRSANIGYYAGKQQITIPHYDINGRFIGLRGRTLVQEEGELYGKYRPIKINNVLYSHPLGLNLYNLNLSKDAIRKMRKAIILESEKSCLQYKTYFGQDKDITVACCGSSISETQMNLLLNLGVQEIIIAFDRQFQSIGDKEFEKLKKRIIRINNKYSKDVIVSAIFDKRMITSYKSSPLDEGKEKFLKLYKERIFL